jgi:hypothetical protein
MERISGAGVRPEHNMTSLKMYLILNLININVFFLIADR